MFALKEYFCRCSGKPTAIVKPCNKTLPDENDTNYESTPEIKSENNKPEILPKDTIKPGNCPDTYQMPMFTEKFCQDMIDEAEFVDNWFE